MNEGVVNWNELNKDPRLRNMNDNRPYWATSAEDYYGRTYESVAYDDTRGDYTSKAFSGDLMYRAANTPFDMNYRDPSKGNGQYIFPSREGMIQKRSQFDKLYPHNTYGGQEFKGIKREKDFRIPVISNSTKIPKGFDAFGNYKIMPRDAVAVDPYSPLSQDSYKITINQPTSKTQELPQNLPKLSDAYVPKNTSTPLLGKKNTYTLKNKFPDQSQDRRNPDTTNQTFSNIDRNISIKSDRMMDIEEDYSLPLWNVRDYVSPGRRRNDQGAALDPVTSLVRPYKK